MTKEKTLWGIPIVTSEETPKGEVIFGSLPTFEELASEGQSLEEWIKAHPKRFCRVTNLETE